MSHPTGPGAARRLDPLPFRSGVEEVTWPALTPPEGLPYLALQYQLQRSQWWTAEQLRDHQFQQLRQVIAHSVASVPFYRDHMRRARIFSFAGITPESFRRWPILTRQDVNEAGDRLISRQPPAAHGAVAWTASSGSTGQPVRTAHSSIESNINAALMLRSSFWHGLDFRQKIASIRSAEPSASHDDWGPELQTILETGPAATGDSRWDTGHQLDWLCAESPTYLLAFGQVLRALIMHSMKSGKRPQGLKALLSYAERPPGDLSELAREVWDVPVHDIYSAGEFGPLAFQCPERRRLHIQSEHVILEILHDDGTTCKPGEVGQVTVTSLHNFAMPLIRYALGDFAVAGDECGCGRGLPVIADIRGRARNLATDPTGRRYWPWVGAAPWLDTPIVQRQLLQHSAHEIEIRYVAETTLEPAHRERIVRALTESLGYPYRFTFTAAERITTGNGEKFEDFIRTFDLPPTPH